MKRLLLLIVTSALLTGCGSTKHLHIVPVETIKEVQVHDTVVLHDVQYDSIYIASNHSIDRGKDTVIIQDQQIEYRYRLLRDTIRITKVEIQRDSIPYEVRITDVKEVPRPRNLFDYMSYICFGLVIGIIGWKCIETIR